MSASLTSPSSTGGGGGVGSHFSFPSHAVTLTPSLLSQFTLVKRAQLGGCVNALDWSDRGDQLLLSTDEPDEAVYLYSTATAAPKKNIFCKRSGCDLVRFTHHTNAVLVASKNKAWDGESKTHTTRRSGSQSQSRREQGRARTGQSRVRSRADIVSHSPCVPDAPCALVCRADSIRYLSLHDNRYLRYFKGHRDRVSALSMSPRDDSFLSAAMDRTVRMWDLRTNVCQGLMHVPPPAAAMHLPPPSASAAQQRLPHGGKILVAHDPAGLVFAVASSPNLIKLYDSRSYDSGPFATFAVPLAGASSYFSWSSLKFSPDGSTLLATTTESCEWNGGNGSAAAMAQNYTNQILLIDSYEGVLQHRLVGHEFNPHTAAAAAAASAAAVAAANDSASGVVAAASSSGATVAPHQCFATLPFEASFSPDGAFVFAGSRSGSIHSWRVDTAEPMAIWNGLRTHVPLTAVQFCPTKATIVSADANGQLLWWMPTKGAIA